MFVTISSVDCNAQRIVFLTHSVGSGLYKEGQIKEWFTKYNSDNGKDILIDRRSYPAEPYPWDNDPYDYWNNWLNGKCVNECFTHMLENYDIVIMKHCYTAAKIEEDINAPDITSNRKSLENYKLQYRAIRNLLDANPKTKFIVFTLTPRHRLRTNAAEADRAKQFAEWVKNEWLQEDGKKHDNIFIFDFWNLIAETDPTPENGAVNCIRYEYEKNHSSDNSHPNLLANETAAPIFARFILNTIESRESIPVAGISVTVTGEGAAIPTDKGTLQLNATITPGDASDNSVTWSVQNGTGEASISPSGLVSAISNGTVTARATANDGSGVYGTLDVIITNQSISVTGITVTAEGGATTITTNSMLQLHAEITPAGASDKSVAWSVENETGQARITPEGLLTAISAGDIIAKATSMDGSDISGILKIKIGNQLPTGIDPEMPEAASINISPSAITIEMNKNTPYERISIYTITGSPVLIHQIKTLNEIVGVDQLLPGIYILVLSGKGEILTKKMVLQ